MTGRRSAVVRATGAIAVLAVILGGCDAGPKERTRGDDPWVLRVQLDERPGMLVAALHPKLWVAYDTRQGSLYGAWAERIHLAGAVYDTTHGPQPTSAPSPLLRNKLERPWHVMRGDRELSSAVQYRGHRIMEGQLYLMYTLLLGDGGRIEVEERPEALPGQGGAVALERTFWIKGLPADTRLAIDTEAERREWLSRDPTRLEIKFDTAKQAAAASATSRPAYPDAERLLASWDCATCHSAEKRTIGPSWKEIAGHYSATDPVVWGLMRKIIEGGSGEWGEVPMAPHPQLQVSEVAEVVKYLISHYDPDPSRGKVETHRLGSDGDDDEQAGAAIARKPGAPGDRHPLTAVHPAFTLSTLRPRAFKPMVGGLAFLPDGRLLVSTWDRRGSVFLLGQLDSQDPERITVKEIASGLQEPLGLKVVDGIPYVLQKTELTRLVDTDGDEVIDEYLTVSNAWRTTGNFHEFAFGLEYLDGWFYGTLATGVVPGGASLQPQLPERGRVFRIAKDSGELEYVARGLRTPNGIGFGVDGKLFVADNQGDWLPANKLVPVEQGAFYGSRAVDFAGTEGLAPTPPLVWLPQDELANSPSQPAPFDYGPYRGQMVYGDVTFGGLSRVITQRVGDGYQGCVVQFTQGLEAGVNRTIVGPDGALYVGGIGNPGNWSQQSKSWYGLQRLSYNGTPVFDIVDVELRSDGVAIAFTEPMRAGDGIRASDYEVRQWRYVPTADYGGPKVDERALTVRSVHVSADRTRVFLDVAGIHAGHVLYVRMAQPMIAESNRELWATESWCTVNAVPQNAPGERWGTATAVGINELTAAERAAGWQPLFDGRSTAGWRSFKGGPVKPAWKAVAGELRLAAGGKGGDIVTDREFGDFELELEWQIAPGGNSGILYRACDAADEVWMTAAEMQVLDDLKAEDRHDPQHRAGAAYGLYAPTDGVTRPPGEFNRARIVAKGSHVEHWLNGHKLLEYDTASEEWKRRVAASKFREYPQFAKYARGRIALQDHGDAVRFRHIRIRELQQEARFPISER